MKNKHISEKTSEDLIAEWMKDPEFARKTNESEPAYLVTIWRMRRGLSQKELAELVGTNQSAIARVENGTRSPTLAFLWRIADALGVSIKVSFIPSDNRIDVSQ